MTIFFEQEFAPTHEFKSLCVAENSVSDTVREQSAYDIFLTALCIFNAVKLIISDERKAFPGNYATHTK